MLSSDTTTARLLVADDQPDVLEALRLLLSQHDFTLQLVTSPGAVLDQVRAARWDAILMDLNYSRDTTSGAEGLSLLAQLRAEHAELPIVVMTAWGNIELAVEAMRAGAQSFVQKPWDNRELVQILEREVADGRGLRERSERHAREQHDALLIQRALMPSTLPITTRFEVVGAWQPAGTLGGDCSNEASPPERVCASVNRLLCGQMIAGRFVTMAYLRLDAARGTLVYANAGHNPPLLARASGLVETLLSSGTVLGVFPEAEYVGAQVALRSGDRLLLYTDGITEARDDAGEEFGESRLTAALVRHRNLGASDLHRAVMEEVTRFAQPGFEDDATLLAVAVL
jgi:FixJ family two-component response regulator